MNWEAIGAVGEIVGALAVLITLIYLSVQIREARKSSEAQTSEKSMERWSAWRNSLLQNNHLVDVLTKADANKELSAQETTQLQTLSDEIFFCAGLTAAASRHTGSLHADTAEVVYVLELFRRNPSLIGEWSRFRPFVDIVAPEFGVAVDEALRAGT